MTTCPFNLKNIDSSWHDCLQKGLSQLNADYLASISQSSEWLPGPHDIFNAFSLPLPKVSYVLFGESPYPRQTSANGYAFWDAAVKELWSPTGLSKTVNRATSLRNILKMLLVAEGLLDQRDTSQTAIAALDKSKLIQTNDELFQRLIQHGFLLLNATPILQSGPPQYDARAWQPFTQELLECLTLNRPNTTFLLLGRIANTIDAMLPSHTAHKLYAEHPYNLSFITNSAILDFFRPFHLLRR